MHTRPRGAGLYLVITMARRSSHHRTQRPSRNAPLRNTPQERPDDFGDEASPYPAAPASKEMTSLMIRQRNQLGPAASESIPVVHVKNRTRHPILYRKQIARIEHAKPGDLGRRLYRRTSGTTRLRRLQSSQRNVGANAVEHAGVSHRCCVGRKTASRRFPAARYAQARCAIECMASRAFRI
jgi:hypothetical protein